ncbi:MAG: 50S ribosomal protein L15 [Alphaproteobacteria bacterium]|nr:MAG: 50S ribosomal protein L15 [Alphaproteobacteria bacterium]
MKLNQLSDNAGSQKNRIRVGRGIGSGKGKTCGRGMKGQKSRSGVAIIGFEGGQMPLHRRLPKRGFSPIHPKKIMIVNVGRIQSAIDAGKLDAKDPITTDKLVASGVVRRKKDGVRLLCNGDLNAKVTLEIEGASKAAIAAVEKAGGKVVLPVRAAPEKPRKKPSKKAKEVDSNKGVSAPDNKADSEEQSGST